MAILCIALLLSSCGGSDKPAGDSRSSPSAGRSTDADKLSGLCFSPFVKDSPAQGGSIIPTVVEQLLDTIAPHTLGIRTFSSTGIGVDIARAANARGLSVAAGCNIEGDMAANDIQVDGLIELCRSGLASIAVVGEETLYFKFLSEEQLIDYIRRVKAAGAKVTTSETWGELIGHPAVISECDVVMANMFPYWEEVNIRDSIEYLDSCYRKVKKAAGDKEVIVETGWPSEGEAKGEAVASPENARTFLQDFTAWARDRGVAYFYFEAFDEPWKANREGSVGAHWGIWDSNGQLKPSMTGVFDR
jgi:exo-beta-1,3-glucanase (GH17 family)